MKVVTWISPLGAKIDICQPCADRLTANHEWPRDHMGQEYCSVARGLHTGSCDICHVDTKRPTD